MGSATRIILLAAAALIVFATGLVLTRAGRPYSTTLLTVHKLVDLAAIVFIVVLVVAAVRGPGLATLDLVLVIATAIAAVATFATGGMVSAGDSVANAVLTAHRLLPWPLVVLLAATVYRLATTA